MMKIGLTGNRYSGKDAVAKVFRQMHIPVFDSDVVFKFLVNHDLEIKDKMKEKFGSGIYGLRDDLLVANKIKSDSDFNGMVEAVEFEMRKAYEKFVIKHRQSLYTIFQSSILFEAGWNVFMDYNISVFCPKRERIDRAKLATAMSLSKIGEMLKGEMDETTKNGLSDYVIHNYDTGGDFDTIEQISNIDKKMIDKYLNNLKKQSA